MSPREKAAIRYRFGQFTLSPARRELRRSGQSLPLIPRYFDLLLLLIERRDEALHRREILDEVWSDVIVSDGALSQAVRILRRTLGDESRTFIRTVSRHGYQFIFPEVVEEIEGNHQPDPAKPEQAVASAAAEADPFEAALAVLLAESSADSGTIDTDRRQAAETLHGLGTAETLRRLGHRPGHATARAYLRETRWDVPSAGDVPFVGHPGSLAAIATLAGLRIRRALRLAGQRWLSGMAGGAVAGAIAGFLGGLLLLLGPGSMATPAVLAALPAVGLLVGGLGAAGVGAGLAAGEAIIRESRALALVCGGAVGGGAIGLMAHLLGGLVLEGLIGGDFSPLAGGLEGFVLGGATGLGYALSTPRAEGGMATPRGRARLFSAGLSGITCAIAAGLLAWSGSYLGAMSLDFMAQSFPDSQVGLDPIARILGEGTPGTLTSLVISAWEGLMFGFGMVFGLTHRPRSG